MAIARFFVFGEERDLRRFLAHIQDSKNIKSKNTPNPPPMRTYMVFSPKYSSNGRGVDGEVEGLPVGELVGELVGEVEGLLVGVLVGEPGSTGENVGRFDGAFDGDCDGAFDGDDVRTWKSDH
jgi:hypothetical protein